MTDPAIDLLRTDLLDRFRDRTLPKHEWTHEAHVAVCWMLIDELGATDALATLRTAIPAYNTAVGTPNTDTEGYHDTLTAFWVGAVAHAGATSVAAAISSPHLGRAAALEHWSRGTLFSAPARIGWVLPDLRPLPWPVAADGSPR